LELTTAAAPSIPYTMLSIAECKKILNKKSKDKTKTTQRVYTDQEVEKIRDFLYQLSAIDLEGFKNSMKQKNG